MEYSTIGPSKSLASKPVKKAPSSSPPPPRLPSAFALNKVPSFDRAAAFLKTTALASVVERVASTLAAVTEDECNYDVGPTELYLAVQDGRWNDVVQRCRTHPREASTWVYRTEASGAGDGGLRWRLLPLHAAALFRAPMEAVRGLLDAHPGGAACADDQGKLPLHLCLRTRRRRGGGDDGYYGPDEGVVSLLARVFPGGVRVADDGGRTPLDLVMGMGPDGARLLRCLGVDASATSATTSCDADVAAPPRETESRPYASSFRPPQRSGEVRMDGELLAKLNRRREALDEQSTNGGIDRSLEENPEYDVDEIMMRKEVEEDIDDMGVEVEYDVDEIMMQEGKGIISPAGESSPSSGGDYDHLAGNGRVVGRGRAGGSIVDLAPPSLRDQMRARVERRRNGGEADRSRKDPPTCDPVDVAEGPHPPADRADVSGLEGFLQERPRVAGEEGRRMIDALNHDEVITVPSSICSSTTGGTSSVARDDRCEREIGIDMGDARNRTSRSTPAHVGDQRSLRPKSSSGLNDCKMKRLPSDLEVYNSTSLETAPTCDMTENPSSSYEDGSLCETYTSSIKRAKSKGAHQNLNRLGNSSPFNVSPVQSEHESDIGGNHDHDDDDATAELIMKAERFFSANSREDRATPSSPMLRVDSGSSITLSKFDQIMAKYESMSVDGGRPNVGKQRKLTQPCHKSCGSPSSRHVKEHTRPVVFPASSQDYGYSINLNSFEGSDNVSKGSNLHETLPKSHTQERPKTFDQSSTTAELKRQPSLSNDSTDFSLCIRQVRSMESDAVSALSMITGHTTIGSVSISTENSDVIESYVQSIVHNIVAYEVENAGSMKKELEASLRGKLKLKAQVKKLVETSNEQSRQLEKEREANRIERVKFNREMEKHLARKAAELEKCTAVASDRAEQSRRLALELAQQDMEREVSSLRSQLESVQSIGVPIDRSLHHALGLVESNQRALRQAAERDARSALKMKDEIERSFINAVEEFEAWSERQLRLMEARWGRV
ncbi:hypothetical protein ACHAW5_004116 [Stephanodiscus triporus]|uniref:Uncharacterized protein n=1 Tax=Stephanodiscus triporus TaxID=2934178 RepID=A0ABD3QHA1_9STRA